LTAQVRRVQHVRHDLAIASRTTSERGAAAAARAAPSLVVLVAAGGYRRTYIFLRQDGGPLTRMQADLAPEVRGF